jgi:hypothetical protein
LLHKKSRPATKQENIHLCQGSGGQGEQQKHRKEPGNPHHEFLSRGPARTRISRMAPGRALRRRRRGMSEAAERRTRFACGLSPDLDIPADSPLAIRAPFPGSESCKLALRSQCSLVRFAVGESL